MIHYQLRCDEDHGFDGWFKDSGTFEKQAKMGFVECPFCGSTDVQRALMAPALSSSRREVVSAEVAASEPKTEILPPEKQGKIAAGRLPAQMMAMLQKIRAEVEKNCDYVGPAFADEARKMHRGEADHRPIYGEATPDQAESLADEGIEIAKIPWVPRADG